MPSSADLQAVHQAYLDNADYDQVGSATKAAAFIVAVRRLIGLLPQRQQHGGIGGESLQFDLRILKEQLKDATDFVAAAPILGGGGFTYLDLSCKR